MPCISSQILILSIQQVYLGVHLHYCDSHLFLELHSYKCVSVRLIVSHYLAQEPWIRMCFGAALNLIQILMPSEMLPRLKDFVDLS